eukprot:9492459-Pyramimonas_sp.AAC.1
MATKLPHYGNAQHYGCVCCACAVRRRLGIAAVLDGPDVHGHARLAQGTGGGWRGRHTELVAAWIMEA